MAQRRFHYERAFEEFLRSRRIPYVAVDEARKALLPDGASLRLAPASGESQPGTGHPGAALKSFDFVIYGDSGSNLLIDVKGRRVAPSRAGGLTARLESWVTLDDIASLRTWQELFGPGFEAAFVFVYWCEVQPPDALFQEIMEHRGAWYALRAVRLDEYQRVMKVRSPRWGTVDIAPAIFERVSQPFSPPPRARDDDLGPDAPALLPRRTPPLTSRP